MREYIFAERNGIHIIDLAQTVARLDAALEFVRETIRHGDSILFVGTKKQAQEAIAFEAQRCGQHYVNTRWLGGMLTNFTTIKRRIQRLEALEARRDSGEFERLTKKEASKLSEEIVRLNNALGGIRRMRRLPGAVFIVDPHRETIAVAEARRLEIPIVAMTDTNCDPDLIDWVIPANDDAIRSVKLVASRVADAVLEAQSERQAQLDEEFEQAEALPPVDETTLARRAELQRGARRRGGARLRARARGGRGRGASSACSTHRRVPWRGERRDDENDEDTSDAEKTEHRLGRASPSRPHGPERRQDRTGEVPGRNE